MDSISAGSVLIVIGIAVSAYHINRILGAKPRIEYFIGVVCGLLFINIGSNLVGSGLHDKLKAAKKVK